MTNFRFSAAANSSTSVTAPDIGATISSIKAGVTQFDDPCVKRKPPAKCGACLGDEASEQYVVEISGFEDDDFPAAPSWWSSRYPACDWKFGPSGPTSWGVDNLASTLNGTRTYQLTEANYERYGTPLYQNPSFQQPSGIPTGPMNFCTTGNRPHCCVTTVSSRLSYNPSTSTFGNSVYDTYSTPIGTPWIERLLIGDAQTVVLMDVESGESTYTGKKSPRYLTVPRGITFIMQSSESGQYSWPPAAWTDCAVQQRLKTVGRLASFVYIFNLPFADYVNCDLSSEDIPLLYKSDDSWNPRVPAGFDQRDHFKLSHYQTLPGTPKVTISALGNYQKANAGAGGADAGADLGGVEIG